MSRVDALRARGWVVAVHNDYRLGGELFTFWLFTKGDKCARGEGRTDDDALSKVEAQVARLDPAPCSNPECEDGEVFEDYCPACEQAIGKPCPACQPEDA